MGKNGAYEAGHKVERRNRGGVLDGAGGPAEGATGSADDCGGEDNGVDDEAAAAAEFGGGPASLDGLAAPPTGSELWAPTGLDG